jgi:hypothetical protein
MRIQETNRILKESAYSRQPVQQQEEGVFSKTWRMMSHLPERLTELFRRH